MPSASPRENSFRSLFMTQPLISCIIPAYNAAAFLAEAIDSIVAQTYPSIEILVVDDGSTDATAAVMEGYGERIISLHQANAGPAAALNAGIRAARGELIAFLDADDVWVADKLARQAGRLEAQPIDITSGRAQNFWDAAMGTPAAELRERLSQPFAAPALTMLARRRLFDSVGLFEEERAHSFAPDWLLRARQRGVVVDDDDAILTLRRLHPGNRSRLLASGSRDEFLRLLKDHLDRRRRGDA